jgi:hypothetical protein
MRSCACDTASRLCVRTVLCNSAFLSVPLLPSTGSAAGGLALFAGFECILLENKVVELGIVDRASDSTIGRALKKTLSQGLPYILVPRVLSEQEWIEKYSPKQDCESR